MPPSIDSRPATFALTHRLAVPRTAAWAALSDADRLAQWWRPAGARLTAASLAFHPGGRFLYATRLPNGQAMWGRFVYRDIEAPRRIVCVASFSDAGGRVRRHPLRVHWPRYVHHTLELAEVAGGTELRLRSRPVHATSAEIRAFEDGHICLQRGFADAWARLDAHLAGRAGTPPTPTRSQE
ncbi:SRPBCC family protein [Denitromonas iodatirespirans]|uniref:SRPBCC domain-containing protein n=1 Tax=Denitromonas iodatirespirans TaxID=2795389 RepID=A0A944DH23_DENI1|nr:SRPBCC domain-containing protein [Denitromonas iodatirespirans]MBT0964037.1 SRPBCC domain-containing protein [Denitromonas iodatirespirans]